MKATVLPGTQVRRINLSQRFAPCVHCGTPSSRHSEGTRRLKEIGENGPTVLLVTYSKHYCKQCQRHFSLKLDNLANPGKRFTKQAHQIALELAASGLTLEEVTQRMRCLYHVHIAPSSLHNWIVDVQEQEATAKLVCS